MNWRAPWLRDRALPLLLATLDVGMILATYGTVARVRTGMWSIPGNGAAFATCCWLMTSYILGRYSNKARGTSPRLFRETVLQVGIASSIIWMGFIVHSWSYQVVDAQTRFRGFVVPVATIIAVLGVCSRLLLMNMSKNARKQRWLIICSEREKDVLRMELGPSELEQLTFCGLEQIKDTWYAGTNIAIGEDVEPISIDYFFLANLKAGGTKVLRLNDWCENTLNRIPSELIDERWFLLEDGFAVQPGRIWWRVKRIGDVLTGLIVGIATIPIVALAACAIKLEDKGPVLYGQERTGIYGTRIKIWKLRSMRVNAEKNGPVWSKKGDVRVTSVGKIIRKTRIDELPQLWNVVCGDLSLIGPRPERPQIEEELEKHIANYRTREWIRPGLSGWAQVSYPYGASLEDSRAKLAYDLYYLKNAGFLMDIMILLKTIRLVIRAEGSVPESER
ncbi:sugar transferase [Synechococcus sp. LTW-R]|uniref:sugar transferase n=1 Tax=Synechococcus sp. LTW-R TaxID=2751170 RepID=UPI0016241E35|nr:sugar transferase [Synechococcus sp. LTW-R]QNG28958.1 sugar transferase [Synechococcus sp. LTW-R]